MLSRPERHKRLHGARRRTVAERLLVLRWVIIALWAVLLIVRFAVVANIPDADVRVFGVIEAASVVLGLAVVGAGLLHAWSIRHRHEDEMLGAAIRRIDPTAWLVQATPTDELQDAVESQHPDTPLGRRVTWGFGATEASLWLLDGRKAVRVLVIRWSRVVHVGVEDLPGRRGGARVVLHYVRPDDSFAVVSFVVRRGVGSMRELGRGPRLRRIVADIAAERITA